MRYLLICIFCSSLFGFDFNCQTKDLNTHDSDWSFSPDFLTLDFEGSDASTIFKNFGPADAQKYSVILRHEWCRSLEKTLFCETPFEALAEVEIFTNSEIIQKQVLRYFLFILNYQTDGSAYVKVRAKRMDEEPPLLFSQQWGVDTCRVSP